MGCNIIYNLKNPAGTLQRMGLKLYKRVPMILQEYTPLKTNMSPENQWLEDVFTIEIVPF